MIYAGDIQDGKTIAALMAYKNKYNNLKYFNKVNLCENCNVLNYKKYMLPFNRVTKTNNCLICKKESKNLVFIKKRV